MALMYSNMDGLGSIAPDFNLPGVDGKNYSLNSFQDKKALLVMFMCNHCPYVIAVQSRINALAREFQSQGVGVIGINPNDTVKYPDDDFDSMKKVAKEQGYVFPYVLDESQETARAYRAVCTPDPFLYENVDGEFVLRYQGRIDDSWKEPEKVTQTDLADAIRSILSGEAVPTEQTPSMGCSIKWKES